jgi:hypothetical protein
LPKGIHSGDPRGGCRGGLEQIIVGFFSHDNRSGADPVVVINITSNEERLLTPASEHVNMSATVHRSGKQQADFGFLRKDHNPQ